MADVEQLAIALRNADAAGDTDAARALAAALVSARGSQTSPIAASKASDQPISGRDGVLGRADATVRGLADTLSFGLADEFAGAMDATFNPIFGTGQSGGSWGERYAKNVGRERQTDREDADQRFGYRLGGQLAGGLAGGVGLAKSGLSATANAINAGKSLPRVSLASAGEGLALGAGHGAGSGEGLLGRVEGAVKGGLFGLGVGGLAPGAVALGGGAIKTFGVPILSRLRPDQYASSALGEGLRKSGNSAEDIAAALTGARADGQGMFTVADAMGHTGGRMISTVTRNPNEMRQTVAEALMARQMDQGGRVAQALGDASGSPLTAAQYGEVLGAERASAAARNYAPVAQDITAMDVSAPVALANRSISPAADNLAVANGAVPTDLAARSAIEGQESAIRDPLREAVRQARSYLAADGLTVTNVEKAFRAKTNIDQMIADATANSQGAKVAVLTPIRNSLDEALAATSSQYAGARDAYAAASRPIEALEQGRQMAAPRTRVDDNLSTFSAMDEASQRAARVGFFDPLIARAEGTAGTMTNAARPLNSQSMRRMLPEIADPYQAELLGRRLGREQQMFETTSAGLGGSKTADNLADAAEAAKYDPGIIAPLMRGSWIEAAGKAWSAANGARKGTPTPVLERIARVLMEQDPATALAMLTKAGAKDQFSRETRSVASALANSVIGSAGGRLGAP